MESDNKGSLETQIEQWRGYLRRRQAIRPVDIDELEDHLRNQVASLIDGGLSDDEAFLVAVKRMGALDAISNEFAREHSGRLWKQLVISPSPSDGLSAGSRAGSRSDTFVAVALAIAAAIAIKVPVLFGLEWSDNSTDMHIYARNFSLFVLPLLTGYFVWKRQLSARFWPWLAGAFVLALLFANIYPFVSESDTEILTTLHLPIALWLVVGVAYTGERWRDSAGRMDFVRFSGELFIYGVLIGLGGGVLVALTMGMFMAIGINAEAVAVEWLMPCGIMGAVIIASWLVEAKQSVIENMAPVLTRLFAPLFALTLLVFLATMVWTGRGIDMERDALIAFDLLLVLVLGLLLYSISARDPHAPPRSFDVVLVVLLVSALIADAVALAAIAARISEFGFTPNRVAALGENIILLVNLGWSAKLYIAFVRNRGSFAALERWQTSYLPVYSIWAALVVIAFPLLFGAG